MSTTKSNVQSQSLLSQNPIQRETYSEIAFMAGEADV